MTAANEVVNLGLKDLGYEYINSMPSLFHNNQTTLLIGIVDDCWSVKSGRNTTTKRIIPDPDKFPSGISGVADQVHALGLKLGIYSSQYLPHPQPLSNQPTNQSNMKAPASPPAPATPPV